jgi:tetratricopeptide (TPR) repeat protein
MKRNSRGIELFDQMAARLHALIDADPVAAIEEARRLSSDIPVEGVLYIGLKASILVDAGASAGDKQAIEDGTALFRTLIATDPKQASYYYNLGNGLLALADQEPYTGFDWYLITAETRQEARSSLQQATFSDNNLDILSVAFTNLGNALWKGHRWAEAYDAYSRALTHDVSNGVASTGAIKVLLRCIAYGIGDKDVLRAVATRHLAAANERPERIAELAGARALEGLTELLERKLEGGTHPDLSGASEYEKFVADHRLALAPTIEGLDCSLKRWDSLRIESITEPIGVASGVPPLFAMFNVMKSDYLAARYLAYQGLSGTFPESGFYSDTLDYAVYGIVPSILALAQRAAIDVLDKVAVATSEYLAIPGSDRGVYFSNRWFANTKKGQSRAWHPALQPHIDSGNTALIALAEISSDVREGGALYKKKAFRHSSTHRFTVLHDLGCDPSRPCVHIEHSEVADFSSHLIESLQLARAVMLYFVEMIAIREASNASDPRKRAAMHVPSHHHIRGED